MDKVAVSDAADVRPSGPPRTAPVRGQDAQGRHRWLPMSTRLSCRRHPPGRQLGKLFDRLGDILVAVSAVMLLLMVVLMGVEIGYRTAASASTQIADEYSGYLFTWMTLCCFLYAQRSDRFLRVDSLRNRWSPRMRAAADGIASLLTAALTAVSAVRDLGHVQRQRRIRIAFHSAVADAALASAGHHAGRLRLAAGCLRPQSASPRCCRQLGRLPIADAARLPSKCITNELANARSAVYGVLLLGCLLGGVGIGAAIGLVGIIGITLVSGTQLWLSLGDIVWNTTNTFTLVSIPLFVLMGEIILRSGISTRFYNGVAVLLRRLPGGARANQHRRLRDLFRNRRLVGGNRHDGRHRRHSRDAQAGLLRPPDARYADRRRLPWHPDSAVDPDDRLRLDDAGVGDRPVHGRRGTGPGARRHLHDLRRSPGLVVKPSLAPPRRAAASGTRNLGAACSTPSPSSS